MSIQAGLGQVTVTPPMGIELSGYGIYLNRRCDGIFDDLKAKALVLDDGEKKLAIVGCDLIGFYRDLTKKIRETIKEKTGIPEDHILLAGTHTHSGPATAYLRGLGEIDEGYVSILPRLIAGAVTSAVEKMEEVTINFGEGHLEGLSFNRVVAGGSIDPQLPLIRVDRTDGTPMVIISNFSCHCVTRKSSNTKVSRDYPGVASDIIEKVFPNSTLMFLQGSCGDLNPVLVHTGRTEEAGRLFAGEILKTTVMVEKIGNGKLNAISRDINLPLSVLTKDEILAIADEKGKGSPQWERFYDEWKKIMIRKIEEGASDLMTTELQILKIGSILLIANPGEIFITFALQMKEKSPLKRTIVVGYANDYVGYIPDRGDFQRKGYAADLVPRFYDSFPFRPDVGDILVQEAMKIANEII